jgi:hypothetical protein
MYINRFNQYHCTHIHWEKVCYKFLLKDEIFGLVKLNITIYEGSGRGGQISEFGRLCLLLPIWLWQIVFKQFTLAAKKWQITE